MKAAALVGPNAETCPAAGGPLKRVFEDIAVRARELSRGVHDHLTRMPAEQRDAYVAGLIRQTTPHFQKWNVEIIHLLASYRRLRFGALQGMLPGISSRTLAARLSRLHDEGFVGRFAAGRGSPEYGLTPDGYRFAQLSAPLIVYVNQRVPAEATA